MKPQLAEDADLDAVRFPCIVQPKIDGVRALNLNGTLTGRSLKTFEGYGITEYFSRPEFIGLDGEMTLGNKPNCGERLCSATTGAMGRFKDVSEMADLHWWVFDHLALPGREYVDRYSHLTKIVRSLHHPRIHRVPFVRAHDRNALDDLITEYAETGYEGTIIRNPDAPYKAGRATKKGQELWRVKPWADAEILVTGVTEGAMNGNAVTTNALGRTERSSHKANMVPNGQVGSVQGVLLADFYSLTSATLLFPKGCEITVSSGEMTVAEATYYWANPDEIVGHVVKFKHMPFGVKDKPRFPTYVSHRLAVDL